MLYVQQTEVETQVEAADRMTNYGARLSGVSCLGTML